MLLRLTVDFLREGQPVHRVNQAYMVYYILYFIGLQPSDEVNPKILLQRGQFFHDFLYFIFPDVRDAEILQRQNVLRRVRFGDGDELRDGVLAVRRGGKALLNQRQVGLQVFHANASYLPEITCLVCRILLLRIAFYRCRAFAPVIIPYQNSLTVSPS